MFVQRLYLEDSRIVSIRRNIMRFHNVPPSNYVTFICFITNIKYAKLLVPDDRRQISAGVRLNLHLMSLICSSLTIDLIMCL